MLKHVLKAAAAGTVIVGMGAAVLEGLDRQHEIDVANCERLPQYCPNRTITLASSGTGGAVLDSDGLGRLIRQLDSQSPSLRP